MLSAGRTGNVVVIYELLHLLLGISINGLFKGNALFLCKVFDELVTPYSP